MKILTKYDPGDMVYLVHDPEQFERMVISITRCFNGLTYLVVCGDLEPMDCYEEELSPDKKII